MRFRRKTFIWVLSLLIIFILVGFFVPQIIPGPLNSLGSPLWKFRELIVSNIKEGSQVFHSKSFLTIENKRLQNELTEAEIKLIKVNLLEKENNELKSLMQRENTREVVLGRVLSRGQSPYDTLIIDVGENLVSKNQKVFFSEGVLIGEVDEVYKRTARVRLLSAPGNVHQIEVGSESIPGEAEGLGGGNFEAKFPRGVDINIGDEIVVPNFDILLLGVVGYIERDPQDPFQRILFKSPINIDQINWVLIE